MKTPSGDSWFQLTPSVAVTSYHGLQPGASGWDSPGKNTGVGCHALLQGIFLTQGSNLCLLCLLCWQTGYLSLVTPKRQTCERNKWQCALIYSDRVAWLVLFLFVCVCVCGAGEVGVHVHMLLQERQFISLIKSSIFNVNLREICLCIQCVVGSECGIQRKTLAQQWKYKGMGFPSMLRR